MSDRINSSPIAILGISEKTVNEFDVYGIRLEGFTDESMTFTIDENISDKSLDKLKAFVKSKVGYRCRLSYSIDEDGDKRLTLIRKYPTL